MKEEPSYMMFSRSNVRGGAQTSPQIVELLLARIDRLEKAAAEAPQCSCHVGDHDERIPRNRS